MNRDTVSRGDVFLMAGLSIIANLLMLMAVAVYLRSESANISYQNDSLEQRFDRFQSTVNHVASIEAVARATQTADSYDQYQARQATEAWMQANLSDVNNLMAVQSRALTAVAATVVIMQTPQTPKQTLVAPPGTCMGRIRDTTTLLESKPNAVTYVLEPNQAIVVRYQSGTEWYWGYTQLVPFPIEGWVQQRFVEIDTGCTLQQVNPQLTPVEVP